MKSRKYTFEDLKFEDHQIAKEGVLGAGSKQAKLDFDNGYGVSVVFGSMFYSNGVDSYELAVMKDGRLHYDNPVADGDVVGYLNTDELMKLVNKVANFPKED